MIVSALLFGLLGSLHCVGMCGPIAFMLPVDRTNNFKKFAQVMSYHLGRLLAYGIIGLLFGLVGKGFQLFGMQQKLSILMGILMIVVVLFPHRLLSKYSISKPLFLLVSKVKSSLGEALKKKTADTFLTIGFLNGFLPCGLVYMAVLGAIAIGTAWQGGLYMILFGLGTIPLMSVAVYAGNFINVKTRQHLRKLVPVMVIIIAVLFILRGMGLGIPYISPAPVLDVVSSQIECH